MGTFQPASVSGLDFEANGVSDVVMDGACKIRFESILATNKFDIAGDCRDIVISGGLIQQINVGAAIRRTRLEHFSHNLATGSAAWWMAAPRATRANVCGGE